MHNLNIENLQQKQYNEVPVTYCAHCLSLNIQILGEQDYCSDCGSTEQKTSSIEEWIELYKQRYGETNIIKKKENGRK